MNLIGKSFIGFSRGSETEKTFTAFNPETGEAVEPSFYSATIEELNSAVELAQRSRIAYGRVSGKEKAKFLRQIADNIEALGDDLIQRATLETGLPNARFEGERGRTCWQFRMFADLVEKGHWVDARIDHAEPERKPLPKPDTRSMFRPVGPIAVFCASNFPLAYSVGGGDTASAFAAGCPVIVNAHNAHPGTAELVGHAISQAVRSCGLPEGVFSLLFSSNYEIGQNLVKHPAIKAVGFTGSQKGGRALMDIAAARDEPIPVYAEMSSINPTFILPSALEKDYVSVAKGLYSSVTLGAGQFCTKPGIVVLPDSEHLQKFAEFMKELMQESDASQLLTSGIRDAYEMGVENRGENTASASSEKETEGFGVNPSLFQTNASYFLQDETMSEEIFGPTTVLIKSDTAAELLEIATNMEGQLTASVFCSEEDLYEYGFLIDVLETKVGRLIYNGFSTGVEVNDSIVHGGVYPATSDSRTSSVGTRAIERFSRLVCYQNFPQESLPDELKDGNPLGLRRVVDGEAAEN
ncbi:MAG: aldehyde dehydrogenase (NADP(+)) [Pyrinomonadaceae bacterium]|nr:aldehyde dehydrogenase (NADP(+)) [Pyrinomonadaceae bacterium]